MPRTKTARKSASATKKNGSDNANGADSVKKDASGETKSPAAERRTFAKPDKPGEKDGEVKDGFRWDKAANDWMDHRGIDFTSDASQLPHNMEHVGDGSPEKPHQVRQVGRWS